MMRKPAVLAAILLGFLTAFVVGQIGVTVVTPTPTPLPAAETDDIEPAVRAFYEAVDRQLAHDDLSIQSRLAPDFVDHAISDGSIRNASGVVAGFDAIRALLPTLQLTVVSVGFEDDMASVELLGAPGDLAWGTKWPIALPLPQTYREFLRIRQGRVAERWSNDDIWPNVDFTIHSEADAIAPTTMRPAIQGFTLDPGQEGMLDAADRVTLRVELGALTVDRPTAHPRGYVYASGALIAAGQTRILDTSGRMRIRNVSTERVEFWTFSVRALSIPAGTADQANQIEQIADIGRTLSLSSTPLAVSFARITLPVGASVLTHHSAILEHVAVLDGALEGESQSGSAAYHFAQSRSSSLHAPETATWGHGFSMGPGDAIAYRVSGDRPVTILVLTIAPRAPDSRQENAIVAKWVSVRT